MSINGTRSVDSFHKELGNIMWEYCGMNARMQACVKRLKRYVIYVKSFDNKEIPGKKDELNQSLEKASRVRFS